MKLLVATLVLSLAVVSPQRLGVRLNPTGGGGGGSIITQSDITLLGYSTMPGWDGLAGHPPEVPAPDYPSTCGLVSGVVHCFTVQVAGTIYSGNYAVTEYIDPGTYGTVGSPTNWTYYRNWGFSSDAVYDMYHNIYGKTYDSGGSLIDLGGLQYQNTPSGLSYHEIAGDRYIYLSYGLPYGAPPAPNPWNLIVCRLDNPGTNDVHQTGLATSCTGPYRICAGVRVYGGTDYNGGCGQARGQFATNLPDNTMGISASTGYVHTQNNPNTGPSLWGGTAWPTLSTPAGFGSTRGGDANLRTTDIQMVNDYLTHYQLNESQINPDGSLNGVPNWAGHRPSYPTASLPPNPPGFANYSYEGGLGTLYGGAVNMTVPNIDPAKYGGVGSWVNGDKTTTASWVEGTKQGVLFAGDFSVGPTWYKQHNINTFSDYGTAAYRLMARNVDEAWWASGPTPDHGGNANSLVKFAVVASHYTTDPALKTTVKYANDGASQSLSCTASGRDITVHLATNGSSAITSTASAVVSNFNATGVCNALATASLCVADCGFANDGSGVVQLMTTDYANYVPSPSGTIILAGGPQISPITNIDLGIVNTGPVSIFEMGIMVYDPGTLSQTPDYNVTPDSFIWLNLIDPNFPCGTLGSFNYNQCSNGGSFFDPTTRKFYVFSNAADLTSAPGIVKPKIAIFQIGGSPMPEPTFFEWLVSLAPNFKKSVAHALTFFEFPR